jgi:endonuclease/exonuclease/phosphatase family metal-dependent hydrolase
MTSPLVAFLRRCRPRGAALSLLLVLPALLGAPAPAAARGSACDPWRVDAVRPVRAASGSELAVATQNLHRFFDDVDDGGGPRLDAAEYRRRLRQLARQLDEVLRRPAVVAVQEAEHQKALADLAAELHARTGSRWQAVLREGADPGGIDVGFLVRADWQVRAVEQLLAGERLGRQRLFDRPPLRVLLRGPDGRELELVNVHLKSLLGSEGPSAARVARKRARQAEALAGWVRSALAAAPRRPLVVLGDFNATPDARGDVDVLGILVAAGLRNAIDRLPEDERYTYLFRCTPEALDHVLVAPALLPAVTGLAASRGNAGAAPAAAAADSPLGSSDHDGLVLYLRR